MLKQILGAFALVVAMALATNVNAQCPPNEVYFENPTDCPKEVTINYGEPCTIFGSVTVTVAPGGATCIPIPAGFIPIEYIVHDPGSGNTGTVRIPECGGPDHMFYLDCHGMCNVVQWHDYWTFVNYPD